MSRDQGLKDCIKYFKNHPEYKRIFAGIREKYASLGHIGGSVTLENPTADEILMLRGLLRQDFSGKNTATVSVLLFERALQDTRFAAYPLRIILEGYFETKLITKREEKEARENEQKEFFHDVLSGMNRDIGRQWLEQVLDSKQKPYALIRQSYQKDRQELAKCMSFVAKALDRVADYQERDEAVRLPVFAAGITGNPHYFDEGSEADRMLSAGLCFLWQAKEPENAEEKAELLYRGGIMKDDISNFTVTYGLVLDTSGASDSISASGASFVTAYEPLHLSLANISRAKSIAPYDTRNDRIYAVENPSVFSAMLDELRKENKRQLKKYPALLCVSGQPRLASLLLMDHLTQNGYTIYYAGDFDPEGLMIADRLKRRYGENLALWRYTSDDYRQALSAEIISPSRLKKLEKIKTPALLDVAEQINKTKRAGYQESIIERYLEDI